MKKRDAGMIALSSNLLCVIGGYGIPSGTIHPTSKFTKDHRYSDGRGWTNEVHVYNTETSMSQLIIHFTTASVLLMYMYDVCACTSAELDLAMGKLLPQKAGVFDCNPTPACPKQ